tara:strand:- start:652 stop:1005 length:354 start_codon:yes stop_codon:yes gene_type:complete
MIAPSEKYLSFFLYDSATSAVNHYDKVEIPVDGVMLIAQDTTNPSTQLNIYYRTGFMYNITHTTDGGGVVREAFRQGFIAARQGTDPITDLVFRIPGDHSIPTLSFYIKTIAVVRIP